jgi:hypothetical protein
MTLLCDSPPVIDGGLMRRNSLSLAPGESPGGRGSLSRQRP